ncbi:MAG: hypothetical protein N3A69_07575, partial [Leptospiraceae bacterium]|nr:hypothetical protein [Leptospiraceae bacterium]
EKDTYKVDMRNTQKNRETLETSIKSIVNESFYSFQLEYFLEEIVKKLINPSYAINKKNAPFHFSSGLKFSSFDFQSSTKLPQISFKNKGDKKFEILLDTLKSYLLQADILFSSKEYEKSLQSYKTILNTIQETTRTEDKQKLSEFLSITQERIRLTQSILLGNELSELDKGFKTEDTTLEYDEILEKYTALLKRYAQLQPYEKTPKLEIAIRERIIYIYEKKAENYYKNLEFSKAHESYKQAYYHANMKELEKKQGLIKESMDTVSKSGTNFVESIVKANCDEAEILNTKYEIEYKGLDSSKAREYKYQAISIMEKTAELIEKEKSFLTPSSVEYYDYTAKNINRESGEILLTPTNVVLFPFRYVGNLLKGIADIFVFKFGWGIGGGGEVGVLGTGAGVGYTPLEYATAYPKIRSKLQEAQRIKSYENIKKDAYYGLAYVYVGTCMNALLFRSCEDLKKYTSANAWVGVGPAVFIGIELHRLVEYIGIIFFQDWDLMNAPTVRFHYFSYKKLEPLSLKFKVKSNPPLFPNFSTGVPVKNRLVSSELLADKVTKGSLFKKRESF